LILKYFFADYHDDILPLKLIGICYADQALRLLDKTAHHVGNWKQWKWKAEMENGKRKQSNLDAHVNYGKTFD